MYYNGDEKMKVFVSWSGKQSQQFAEALKEWLEQCIQSVEVFFSPDDIEKGENWQAKISNELQDTNYGIVCLTAENINAPWVHFEAGALSKLLDSRVMVLAININFSDIKGPLKSFQATKLEKEDVFKLLKTINGIQDKPLGDEKLKNSFEAFWPQFQEKIEKIKLTSKPKNKSSENNNSEIVVSETVDEILQIVRSQNALINSPEKLLPADYLEYVFKKNGTIDSADMMLEEIYEFTKYYYVRIADILNYDGMRDFWKEYTMMIRKITRYNKNWRIRFSRLLYDIEKSIEIADPDDKELN